jgi:superfamily II DNA helicase RecQ
MDASVTQSLGRQEVPSNAADICRTRFGVTSKEEQLQVAGLIGHGKDVVLIAGCGWGKSLVYYLPLAFWDRGVIVIISPLRAIMIEQHQNLQELGFSSLCMLGGHEAITDETIARLKNEDYRAVFATPEIMFENPLVVELWNNSRWHSQLRAIVLDEAHCVFTWGTSFRRHYSQLGLLRPRLPPHVAFVALSATLPQDVLQFVKSSTGLASNVTVINTGNDRPNVKLLVMRLQTPHLASLDFLLESQQKTIIYFDDIKDLHKAHIYLTSRSTAEVNSHIASYFAILSDEYKDGAMERFRSGEVRVLLASEAAGMGCNVSDIVCVVQYKAPSSILTLVQRLGRAARTPGMQGYGIVLCTVKELMGIVEDSRIGNFLTTSTCRRQVFNEVFGNRHEPNDNCCDLCHPEAPVNGVPTISGVPLRARPFRNIRYISKGILLDQEERAYMQKELREWRRRTYDRNLLRRIFFQTIPDILLSDGNIEKLVAKAPILKTGEDITETLKKWSPLYPAQPQELAELVQATIKKARTEAAQRMIWRP